MKITDLKIGTQLKISFGIMLMLFIILSAISWYQTNMMSKQTTDLYDHPMKVRRALGDLRADILSIQLEYRNLLIAKNEKDQEEALVNSKIYQANTETSFAIISDQYLGSKSDVEAAHAAYLRWVSLLGVNQELVKSGRISEAQNRLDHHGDLGKERELMMATIKIIDDFAKYKGDQLFTNSVELKKSLDRQLALLVAGILAFTALITLILIRNILVPITELTKVTMQFGEGKYEAQSSYISGNELGMLSQTFNSLARTIQEEFVFKDRSASLNAIMLKGLESNSFLLQVLEPLMKLTHSQVGAIYLLDDQKSHFEHLESVGLDTSKIKSFSAIDFEGELGIALVSKKIEHITNIPSETQFSFSAVSGKFRPKELITIPLIDKEEVIAMISLATLHEYDTIAIRLITDMQAALAAWMNALIANRKIQKLSEYLKTQNQELEVQKKELASQAGELFEQNTELEMQKKQLFESNQLKSSFLSNMSHELRTPLNSVIALSGVLNRRLINKIPTEEYSYLHVIERNGKQLLSLINDILDLSRIEAGYEEIIVNQFNVNELISEVVDLIEPQAILKNIKFTYSVDKELPVIHSDYQKCRHILQNIVANAIKFTENGEVHIEAKASAQNIHIEVKDTGIGIEEEFLPKIFDEYRQADSSNARKFGGTGLGLSIAKKYTDFLGGSILVESERWKGSKFTLILPVNLQKRPAESASENTPIKPQSIELEQNNCVSSNAEKTILVVEDSEAIVVQLKDILTSQGYKWMVARNGSEALNQIASQIPDAMILDLMMPEVDGFEVLRCIRENEETSHIPVVILTAKYVTKEELAFLKYNNVQQLIQKGDINKNQLLNAVSRMVFPQEIEAIKQLKEPEQKPYLKQDRIISSNSPIILIVEDNPDNMLTIKALLDGYGEIIEASDGACGIEMAKKLSPHLILMDIALPGKSGIETLQTLRLDKTMQDIPVIAVSASAMKGDREHFIASGFNEYIPKPIDNKMFTNIIKKYLDIIT